MYKCCYGLDLPLTFLLQWLEQEFIPYLDEWEKSVEDREGFSNLAKKQMLLSPATLLGIRMTGMYVCMPTSLVSLMEVGCGGLEGGYSQLVKHVLICGYLAV